MRKMTNNDITMVVVKVKVMVIMNNKKTNLETL